jgi:endoglucanase
VRLRPRLLSPTPRGTPCPPQVGDGQADHNLWRRAEDVTETRPVGVCTPSKPGSDVAGAIAGALAATAVAFKGRDPGYAARALEKAKMAYK